MSSHLGTTETLALLRKLAETIREFAGREDKLNAEFRSRSAAENRRFEAEAVEQAARAAEALAHAEAAFRAEREKCESRFEQRKSRISKGHMASRSRAMETIRTREGRQKYKTQEGTINAERRRDKSLAEAAAAFEQFNLNLQQAEQESSALELQVSNAFRGYGRLRPLLAVERGQANPDPAADANQLLEQLSQSEAGLRERLNRFRKMPLPMALRHFPFWLSIVLLLAGCAALFPVVQRLGGEPTVWRNVGFGFIGFAILCMVGRALATSQAGPVAVALGNEMARSRQLLNACHEKAQASYRQEQERIKREYDETLDRLDREWKKVVKETLNMLDVRPRQIDEQAQRVTQKNEHLHAAQLKRLENEQPATLARLSQDGESEASRLAGEHDAKLARLKAESQEKWKTLEADWRKAIQPIHDTLQAGSAAAKALFPDWGNWDWPNWAPPQKFENAAQFGRLEVNVNELADAVPKDKRLAFPGPASFAVPLVLTYPTEGSIIYETRNTGAEEALAAINNIIFRLLSTTPPGKLSFTIFDPVGLGQNFAGLMHLADYEESHINSRIWTQTTQLEEKLAELNEHMEKVIQMYLRNEYETIAEYNAQAGTIAEKYHFLVVADFPVNFSDSAARRLINIATSGARCGVYMLIHWDRRHSLPQGFVADELRKRSICVVRGESGFKLDGNQPAGTHLALDTPPSPEFATEFLHKIGESGKGTNRVEVPFEQVAPEPAEMWTEETTEELTVPIGRSGATKLQYLAIGKGTRQHALIAGKTGSGKSTLFHVMITNLALWCSPEQVEFYLVDFKKGVEFKCYATRKLPHARVVAIESDREFGLSVLERVDAELRRRGDLFRQLGVQDVAGYKRAGGSEAMPRSLLIIDEFQEFFTEEDRVSQNAAVLLDRIVRQGRAFGIHVLLGSQTLGGAYTLARATIGQMVIRIALQCNEADAYLIMDQDNPAPRLLSRPGEGIYNDSAGSIEGNSPFQAVWLPEDVRDDYLARIRERAGQSGADYPAPFVFEGSAPADVRENLLLNELLKSWKTFSLAPSRGEGRGEGATPHDGKTPHPAPLPSEGRGNQIPAQPRIWLGAPNSVKGPTEAVFQRQSGSNLLIVGQSEEPATTIVAVALVALAAQYPKGAARFLVLDSTPPGIPQREFLERVIGALPHEIVQVKNSELAEAMTGLAEELKRRSSGEVSGDAPETFVFIHGLQNYKRLKPEDEFGFSSGEADTSNPAAVLPNLISEGPSHGIHVITTLDTYNNVTRFLGRKALSEFEMRMLFQMSASDSASLIDEPDASKLGLHRALYYNDREGYIETFRPYALPGNDWIGEVARNLAAVNVNK